MKRIITLNIAGTKFLNERNVLFFFIYLFLQYTNIVDRIFVLRMKTSTMTMTMTMTNFTFKDCFDLYFWFMRELIIIIIIKMKKNQLDEIRRTKLKEWTKKNKENLLAMSIDEMRWNEMRWDELRWFEMIWA